MPTLAVRCEELAGLELVEARKTERALKEGQGRHGKSAAVQVVGRKR